MTFTTLTDEEEKELNRSISFTTLMATPCKRQGFFHPPSRTNYL